MRKNTVAVNTQSQVFGQADMQMKNTYQGLAGQLVQKYGDQFVGVREVIDEEFGIKVQTQEFTNWLALCGKHAKGDALVLTKMLFDAPFPEEGFVIDYGCMITFISSCIDGANTLNNDVARNWGWSRMVQRTPEEFVDMFINLGYVKFNENGQLVVTDKYWKSVPLTAVLPQAELCTKENRRFGYTKSGEKMSKDMWIAVSRLQREPFYIDEHIFDIYGAYIAAPKLFKEEEYIIVNSVKVIEESGLYTPVYSEWGADARGRLYMLACASANPQTSDLARSIYSHCVPNFVNVNSDAYNMFIEEMKECAGGSEWMGESRIRMVANNVSDYLVSVMSGESSSKPAKPFTYARLCKDWVKFQDEGKCDSRVAFGLDAKNSGTQYLAVLAGDENISGATGITTVDKSQRVADPYVQSLGFLKQRVSESNMKISLDSLTRDLVKTPYMAIQYRGTVNALLNSQEWQDAMAGTGLFNTAKSPEVIAELAKDFSAKMVDSIYDALGENIMAFIEGLESAVKHILEVNNITHFKYAMSDGFVIDKPCFAKWVISEPEAIRLSKNGARVIFGYMKEGKSKPWTVNDPNPSGEEFIRTFVVNYIQGMDALVARAWAKHGALNKLRGMSAIHDCFRTCLEDAPKLKKVIADTYKEVFVGEGNSVNLQLEHIAKELMGLGAPQSLFCGLKGYNPVAGIGNEAFLETMYHDNSYYFCQ